ncbi:hypothetical protein DID88_010438 [Monilinia fructigena]|uniref:Pre-mRNA polyadenylation factor Fip1 domain-containing protein n=1 Tax=Monilinia fructigena TaxID=38457 RepID=A0A395INF0_9HELO|nr:hypothetical protein DID88_010438 [Monilinia fructigena]
MDVDEDDDFYAPEESVPLSLNQTVPAGDAQVDDKPEQKDEDLERGYYHRKKEGAPPPTKPQGADYNDLPSHSKSATGADAKASTVKTEQAKKGSDTPAISGAELPAGKPITQINIDEDLNENDKPWRRPGTDISDYFNYGFDEFTWALYANKQESLRSEFDPNKNSTEITRKCGMPGMEGMTPEMMQQMQQMMASGMDPSQMDPSMFGGSGSAGGAGGFGGGQFGGGALIRV